jgi:hypothetical protein
LQLKNEALEMKTRKEDAERRLAEEDKRKEPIQQRVT